MTSWLKEVEPEIRTILDLPSWGEAPPFPVQAFTETLKEVLALPADVTISIGSRELKKRNEAMQGVGLKPIVTPIECLPLEGALFWVMGKEDLVRFFSWVETPDSSPLTLEHPDLIKGLYRYLMVEALHVLAQLKSYPSLSFKLSEQSLPDESLYTIMVSITKGSEILWGKLCLSSTFLHSFTNHFAAAPPSIYSAHNLPEARLPLALVMGSTTLSQTEWNTLEEGDLLVIENSHFRPSTGKGTVQINLGKLPVFQAKLKEGHVKILDFIYSYKETKDGF